MKISLKFSKKTKNFIFTNSTYFVEFLIVVILIDVFVLKSFYNFIYLPALFWLPISKKYDYSLVLFVILGMVIVSMLSLSFGYLLITEKISRWIFTLLIIYYFQISQGDC